AALAQHPGVRESVVRLWEPQPGDQRLAAYVVPEGRTELSSAELREFLRRKLPDPMVPAAYVCLTALPLTPNGKVNRQALPDPSQAAEGSEARSSYVAPRTATEEAIAQIWGELLGLEQVGIHNDFFSLGGHSLLAVRVMGQVKSRCG